MMLKTNKQTWQSTTTQLTFLYVHRDAGSEVVPPLWTRSKPPRFSHVYISICRILGERRGIWGPLGKITVTSQQAVLFCPETLNPTDTQQVVFEIRPVGIKKLVAEELWGQNTQVRPRLKGDVLMFLKICSSSTRLRHNLRYSRSNTEEKLVVFSEGVGFRLQ